MIEGEFGNYLEDPYTQVVPRDPAEGFNEIVLLGGGFGTLICAWKLREKGFKDIRVIENGGGFGGTWVSLGKLELGRRLLTPFSYQLLVLESLVGYSRSLLGDSGR